MADHTLPEPSTRAMVTVEDLTKVARRAGSDAVILDSVSFAVPCGSLFTIVGPSGSGKSALLRIVCGIERPTVGRVLVAGSRPGGTGWRPTTTIGLVGDLAELISSLSVEENIRLALELGRVVPRQEWHAQTMRCLQAVAMEQLASKFPDELFEEQLRRAAIARALANDPPLLVADNPTARLHTHAAHAVIDLLEALSTQSKTVLVATPDPEVGARATDHIALRDGRIHDRSYSSLPGLYA